MNINNQIKNIDTINDEIQPKKFFLCLNKFEVQEQMAFNPLMPRKTHVSPFTEISILFY